MEKNIFEDIEKLDATIKTNLERVLENETTEQLKNRYKLAKENLNNLSPAEQEKQKESFKNFFICETIYEEIRTKTANRIFEEVKQKIEKAQEQLFEADELLNFILNEGMFYFRTPEHQNTQSKSNKIFNIILQLKELLND